VTAIEPSLPVLNSSSAVRAPVPERAPQHHFSFSDVLDIVNPLQHLPVIGTLYRKLTHDEIGTPEKIMGDTLYGGVPGLISSVADTAFEKITGKNFADTALSLFDGGDSGKLAASDLPPEQFALADNRPTLAFDGDETPVPKPVTEEEVTASLNGAQLKLALAARASLAYAHAADTAKPTDVASIAY
jgi:hypothetical protein